ncbi:MAG: 2OG-Fe(II) oxygenase [Pseudomonadota bacterium]|nr:2OG-Fe(II) oxygenase [Pseudomonadota bacterium]
MLREIFYNIYTKHVEPFYGVEIEWWEKPQLLCYLQGGKYGAHADADQWQQGGKWKRNHDRDVSVLLYLNDDFTGGKLNFPNQKLKVQPEPGLLVAFPSHHEYLHGAEPTESGVRYALVSWAAIKGLPRLREPPPATVFMREFRQVH